MRPNLCIISGVIKPRKETLHIICADLAVNIMYIKIVKIITLRFILEKGKY